MQSVLSNSKWGTSIYEEPGCRSLWMDTSCTRRTEGRFSYISFVTVMFELISGRWENTKQNNITCNLPRFSFRKKNFWSSIQNGYIHWKFRNTVFSLVSAHACNSIFIALTIWNEMGCLNRSCSADLVLCTVYSVRLSTVSQRQLIDWAEKTNIELQTWADIRENTVLFLLDSW